MKYVTLLFLLLFITLPGAGFALSTEETIYTQKITIDDVFLNGAENDNYTITDAINDYVDVPKGGTHWKVFATTSATEIQTKTDDGYDSFYTKPTFTAKLIELDGTHIKIQGYMFPLDGNEVQKSFLFGPFPLSCPFHYHVGPSLIIEVHAHDAPVTFSYDPVTIEGTLELVMDDPKYSVFYRLKNARRVD